MRTYMYDMCVCVYYFRTYYKAVRGGGRGEWRTCAMRDDEPRPVWMSLLITHSDTAKTNNSDTKKIVRGSPSGSGTGMCVCM